MIDLVYQILKEFKYPTKYLLRPAFDKNNVAISYHFYGESYGYYGDGDGKNHSGTLQVDIFHKSDIETLPRDIIRRMKRSKFRFAFKDTYVEDLSGLRLYHTILRFNFWESEVKNEGDL